MRVIEVIGRGGFARVERVELDDGRICARKVFDPNPEFLADVGRDKLLRRFSREVRIQRSLPADFFLPVLQADLGGAAPWFTMPLAERSLDREIAEHRNKPSMLESALADILNALESLHELGYPHRDLTPSNILLHDGIWKLADFGLVAGGPTGTVVSSQTIYGTPPYCSPEQWLDFHTVTPATDIYAFGCILHDIFDGTPRLPHRQYTCNGPIAAIVERCTNERPEGRYASIRALRAALFTALQAPADAPLARNTTNWIDQMGHCSDWEANTSVLFGGFVRTLPPNDVNAVALATDEDFLIALSGRDPVVWRRFADFYCEWADRDLSFAYCDVVGQRLVAIFENGQLPEKVAALIAMARMGARNNRWFVMRLLQARCGPNADEALVRRLAIEIKGTESEWEFRRCAEEQGDDSMEQYHPLVKDACGEIDDF